MPNLDDSCNFFATYIGSRFYFKKWRQCFFLMYLCSWLVICREYSNNWEGSLLHLISIRKLVPYLFQFEVRKSLKVVNQSMKVFSSEIVILFHYLYVNVQGFWSSFVWSIKSFSLLLNSKLISPVSFLS